MIRRDMRYLKLMRDMGQLRNFSRSRIIAGSKRNKFNMENPKQGKP